MACLTYFPSKVLFDGNIETRETLMNRREQILKDMLSSGMIEEIENIMKQTYDLDLKADFSQRGSDMSVPKAVHLKNQSISILNP